MKLLRPSLLFGFERIGACFTTRIGGVSSGPFESANLAFHVGDDPESVTRTHALLAEVMGYDRHTLVHMRQIHSDRVLIVDETMGFDTPPECDALITDRPNVPLMAMSADCTPILIYDPIRRAIGAIHAGRAGALKEILPKTIRAMQEAYGSRTEDLHVVLGPSIHSCCYEVNAAIATQTQEAGYAEALRYDQEQVFLDVNTILTMQLEAIGIDPLRTETIPHCTSCMHDTYFSYRADKQHTGRIGGVIILR